MLNKSYILAGLAALALAGCTREVYLQPVPCEPECPSCPCFVGASECCPETAVQTVVTTYQVYDVPAPTVTPPAYTSPYQKIPETVWSRVSS